MRKTKTNLLRITVLIAVVFSLVCARAQTFTGTNAPGTATDFNIQIGAGTTNIALTVGGSATAFSHLLLKSGVPASDSNYDFISQLDGGTSTLNIEVPELLATNYYIRVRTPANSATHAFTLLVESNRTDVRTVRPVSKPLTSTNSGTAVAGTWYYYRVEIPTNSGGWRAMLDSAGTVDLYLQRSQLPTTAAYLKRSTGATNDIVALSDAEAQPGAYFIGVFATTTASYVLRTENVALTPINFDAGLTQDGTDVYSNTNAVAGDFYFKIRTTSPALGAWRTGLKVVAGEADLYMSRGVLPTVSANDFKSERTGSDGVVLGTTQFSAGQDWYILVHAAAGSQWSLVSGAPYVMDLGTLAADSSSSAANITIGPEGIAFFQTTIPSDALAWRLGIGPGKTNGIYLKKTGVPLPISNELTQPGQMLVVPPYLAIGQSYFVAVVGNPGTTINLDSREQPIIDVDLSSSTNQVITDFGYTTYRVQLPPSLIAWEVNLSTVTGNPNVAIRRSLVPNENYNDAFSENPGTIGDSISLVPLSLANGTWFITVYGTNTTLAFTLQNGPPVVTDINYSGSVTNDNPSKIGWRYYRVPDTTQQAGTLGWDLYLTNYTPGTRIALRRTSVPGIWTNRNPNLGTQNNYDLISAADFLQQPGHQADIWYVGVYNPSTNLGPFTLVTRELPATDLTGDGDLISRTNVTNGKWEFYRLNLDLTGAGPQPVLGWDLRLLNVTSGLPKIVVRRDAFPSSTSTTLSGAGSATNWPSGAQWAPTFDWTRRQFAADGTTDEYGRIFAAGAGRPLESATYYIGILNTASGTNTANYTLASRFIGNGWSIPVTDLNYAGGRATNNSLMPREAAYYHVAIPSGVRSWKVRLTTNMGEAMLVVSSKSLPNIESEKRMQKLGKEHYVLLPPPGQTNLAAGDYYLAVVAEGTNVVSNTRISTGACSYVIESLGAMPEIDLGSLDSDVVLTDTLEGGESKAYHFEPPVGSLGYAVAITDRIGNPTAVVRSGNSLIDPGVASAGVPGDVYGNEGGENLNLSVNQTLITVVDPSPIETLMIKARSLTNAYPDASYTLTVSPLIPARIPQLAFDGGTASINNQIANGWIYYRIVVPTNALGWDLRLTNVTSGSPKIVVARDHLPNVFTTTGVNPVAGTNWPTGGRWAAGADWTGRSFSTDGTVSEDGRILEMGMNRPLEPGTYYVGISSVSGTSSMSYTIVSRGIGDGFKLPVQDLAFAGGSISVSNLPIREAAYFRVQIPTNTPSWKVRLATVSGEAMLLALKDVLPSVIASSTSSSTNALSPGRKMQKTNDEFFVLQPNPGQTSLVPGTYYLAAISEGYNPGATRIGSTNSTFTMNSYGFLQISDLGSLTSDIYTNISLGGGETVAFQFNVPPATYGFEIRLENRTGNPVVVYRAGSRLPDPGVGVPGASPDTYGCEGGEITSVDGSPTQASPLSLVPGIYSIVVKARQSGPITPDATFTLHIDATTPPGTIPFPFDGSTDSVTNQPATGWRYYAIDVPAGALGWDVRLTNVTSGNPKMVVRRDVPPLTLVTTPWSTPGSSSSWATSNQWTAGADWTRRSSSASGTNEDGRILAMGMGRPLEPGQYIIGITNSSGTNAMSYTFVSRGIGAGYSLPVIDLPFNGGSATNTLLPREAAYYSIVVPSNAPSWKMRLQVTSGEAMMVCLSNRIPNIDTFQQSGTIAVGKGMQKSGNEHYLMLPALGQTSIAPGTNYFAVIGEGVNPVNSSRTGVGPSSYMIQSMGPLQTNDLGLLTSTDLEQDDTLLSGETKGYSFAVPFETLGFEFRLENRVGTPVAMYRPGTSWPDPGAAIAGVVTAETYGNEGGYAPTDGHSVLITVPNPVPGIYSAVVKARAIGGVFSDASYHLRVREILAPEINFGAYLNTNGLNNVVSGTLEDNQRAFFVVHVPATYNGGPVIGWKLDLRQTSGSAFVRVRKDLLPSDTDTTGSLFTTAQAILAAPYLTNGTFYVEVKGSNSTSFTLTSNPIELERPAFVLPSPGQTNTPPGLAYPFIGDTGVDTNGVPIPGDQSTFLDQGYEHFYCIMVPTNNLGLVRVSLETSSGNPDVYARYGLAPSVLHNTGGITGPIYWDRAMTSTNTEYANWVPIDGKIEAGLRPGPWYLMVRANGNSSARYRLRVSAGDIQDLNISGDGLANQTLLAGDWRYYRVQMPTSLPLGFNVTFSQQTGDVWMYVRDTMPPGQGTTAPSYRDWVTDAKNNGPYGSFDTDGTYSFVAPAVRPGNVYYIGFRAVSDATFSVSVATNGGPTMEPQTIAFYGGSIATNMPPYSQVTYRIDVPPDAARWKHSSTHSTNLQLSIEQGTVPYKSSADDFRSSTANSSLNKYLLTTLNAWPWVPNQSYFLTVTNTSSGIEPLTFTMDGKSVITDDNDSDLLPDAWELAYFGNTTNIATGDFDGDGVANIDEYLEGTNPADNTSFRPRLVTAAANGSFTRDITQPSYAMGQTVMVTPVPNAGFAFVNWTGDASGTAVPYPIVMNGHKFVSALFKVTGDDFSIRVPLFGKSVTANSANIGATKEPGEPNHAGNPGGKSVWWTWSPVSGGPVTISTAGSTFNTVLAVYTGSSVSNLTLVASDNNSLGGTNRSSVTFTPNPCATYQIAVDGLWAASGYITLSINQAATPFLITGPTKGPGGFQFTVHADPNQVYVVDSSTDLVNWVQLGLVTNGCSTAIPVTDTSATNAPKRFYRFRLP